MYWYVGGGSKIFATGYRRCYFVCSSSGRFPSGTCSFEWPQSDLLFRAGCTGSPRYFKNPRSPWVIWERV